MKHQNNDLLDRKKRDGRWDGRWWWDGWWDGELWKKEINNSSHHQPSHLSLSYLSPNLFEIIPPKIEDKDPQIQYEMVDMKE